MNLEPELSEIDEVRVRRMAESWREDAPSSGDVAFAAVRFRAARSPVPRRPGKVLVVAVIQGFAVGIVSLAAASWTLNRVYPVRAPVEVEPVSGTGVAAHRAVTRAPVAPVKPIEREAPLAVPAVAFGDAPTASTLSVDVRAPTPAASGAAREPPSGSRGAGPVTTAPADRPNESAELGVAALPATGPSDGPWARVARALAASDWRRADDALADLAASTDPQTRDAADLARAQLWIAHGRGDAARATLERLASSAPTPLVRRRASGLLERLR